MRTIEIKQLNYDPTAIAGLALVGDHLKTIEPVLKRVDKALSVRAGVANSDIVRSCVGLLVQGKSDFDAPPGTIGSTSSTSSRWASSCWRQTRRCASACLPAISRPTRRCATAPSAGASGP